MSFSQKRTEAFGNAIQQSPFNVDEAPLRIDYVKKGNNIIFGRASRQEHYDNLIYLGKVIENGLGANYLGADAWLDVSYPHVAYITGTRGSGKSFDLGVILEGISELAKPSKIQNNVQPATSILIDTQSQFWTLRFAPKPEIEANKAQLEELGRWKIEENSLKNTRVFVPPGSETFLGDEVEIKIRPRELTHEDWCSVLGQDVYSPQGHILSVALEAMGSDSFELADLIQYVSQSHLWADVAESSRNALKYKLDDLRRTNLFSSEGLTVSDYVVPGMASIFMVRDLRNEDKALVTGLIARQLFKVMGQHHNKKKISSFFGNAIEQSNLPDRVWLLIDEAHVIAPQDSSSAANQALIEYVKRGRDCGLSLVLATQQPSAVDDRILSQINLTLNHRLTFQNDIQAATKRVPTKPIRSLKYNSTRLSEFGDMMRILDAGQAFIGDHSTGRSMILQVRPRVSAHGGYSPI